MKKKPPSALASWRQLNEEIAKLTEQDLVQLLRLESGGRRRRMVLRRLHQRLTRLRATRERRELMK